VGSGDFGHEEKGQGRAVGGVAWRAGGMTRRVTFAWGHLCRLDASGQYHGYPCKEDA